VVRRSQPTPHHCGFTILELIVVIIVILGIVYFLGLPVTRSREASRRSACKNNIKQIGLALHNYHDTYGGFPPAYTVDEQGKPLHSWRTLILPFVDQAPLYDTIDLTKPWDDPANAEAYKAMPPVYGCPSTTVYNKLTVYHALITDDSFLTPTESRVLEPNSDNAETLMVIEVAEKHAVHWMDPQVVPSQVSLGFNEETEFQHQGGTHGLMVDGAVRFVAATATAEERENLASYKESDSSLRNNKPEGEGQDSE
jgi:type II secretory pathway pseudopilin PulG